MIITRLRGLTLLETMLVLAIAASIILMGLKQYELQDTEKNYLLLKYNVEELFQGLKQYYQVNCDDMVSASGTVTRKGTLSPHSPQPVNTSLPFPVSITTLQPYLQKDWPRYAPVVENPSGISSYIAQFNPSSPPPERNAYACQYFGSGAPQCTDPLQRNIVNSKILLWQAQVAVKMLDPSKTIAYVGVVGADCAVNDLPSDRPINCSTDAVKEGNAVYMVWQRLPSFASTTIKSAHQIANPVAKQFKLQYTHDPMYEMYNQNSGTNYQYYLCGG